MITTIDAGNRIKVYKLLDLENGRVTRKSVGSIRKVDYVVPENVKEQLSDDDQAQLDDILSIYKRADKTHTRHAALSLPLTLYMALDYVRNHATESEIEMIASAIDNARRELIKHKRMGEEEKDIPEI